MAAINGHCPEAQAGKPGRAGLWPQTGRGRASRPRRPLALFVFSGTWCPKIELQFFPRFLQFPILGFGFRKFHFSKAKMAETCLLLFLLLLPVAAGLPPTATSASDALAAAAASDFPVFDDGRGSLSAFPPAGRPLNEEAGQTLGDWRAFQVPPPSKDAGKTFYFNTRTKQRQWTRPHGEKPPPALRAAPTKSKWAVVATDFGS